MRPIIFVDYQDDIDKFLKGFVHMEKGASFEDSVDKRVKMLDFEGEIIRAMKDAFEEGITYGDMLDAMTKLIYDLSDESEE